MTMIAWVNMQTNVCENVSTDERPVSEIPVPGYLLIDLDALGHGWIGWVWDGSDLIKPVEVTPDVGL